MTDHTLHFATAWDSIKLDTLAVESGLSILQMMELAGYHMVEVFHREDIDKDARIVITAGKGNKGGDGLCAARHLINNGWKNVTVILATDDLKSNAEHHRGLLQKMRVPIYVWHHEVPDAHDVLSRAQVVIDALVGYGLKGAPVGTTADILMHVNRMNVRKVSYDVPTGVDSSTGESFDPCIKADVTLTLGLPKKAFQTDPGKRQAGKIYLADIGIPEFLYKQVNPSIRSPFAHLSPLSVI